MSRKFVPVTLAIATLICLMGAKCERSENDWLGGYRPEWNNSPQQQQEQWQKRQLGDVCCNNNVQREPEWTHWPEAQRIPQEEALSKPRFGGASQAVNEQYREPVSAQHPRSTEPSFHNPD